MLHHTCPPVHQEIMTWTRKIYGTFCYNRLEKFRLVSDRLFILPLPEPFSFTFPLPPLFAFQTSLAQEDATRTRRSASDAAHGTRRRNKIRLANVMPRFLLQHDLCEPAGNRFVGSAPSQPGTQVMLGDAEQACAYLAVGGQANPITVSAE